jgi:hypothetical protein
MKRHQGATRADALDGNGDGDGDGKCVDSSSGSGTKSQLLISLASLQGSLSRDKRRVDWRNRERSAGFFIAVRSRWLEPGFSDFPDRDLQ